jgi:hypothetical protein
MITDWTNFKEKFKEYILNTIGLFTINNPSSIFNLDRFLIRQYEIVTNNKKISITQIEMLMALSTFIDIQENLQTININIFPKDVIFQLQSLIINNLIQLHPYSDIKKYIMNYEYKFLIEI